MSEPLLALRNLTVRFEGARGAVEAVRGVDIDIARGEVVAIVGESGSGKSQTMLAALGLLSANGRAAGSAMFDGRELIDADARALNAVRGSRVTMIFQEPMSSLDPLTTIGAQIAAPLIAHGGLERTAARARAVQLLGDVGFDDPQQRLRAYPHQLSGGQRQRVMIAMAIANRPDLLIADEPTTALDVTVQAQILELLLDLQRRLGMAMAFITHDLGLVRRIAQRVYVMRAGQIVEHGLTADVLDRPQTAYARALVDAEPADARAAAIADAPVLYDARGVSVTYALRSGVFARARPLHAVRMVDLTLRRGQTLGIVGESGSGKSTLGRALLRLTPASGVLHFDGHDLQAMSERTLRPLRRQMQLVFQDPFGSLSPRMRIGDIVIEGLLTHDPAMTRKYRERAAARALASVGLENALAERTPDQLSGGQRQRVAIARAVIQKPQLVVLDEPTSALDRSVQRDVLALLQALQAAHGLTYVFISHDLSVIRAVCDDVLVMKEGCVVEHGSTRAIFKSPAADYTRTLIAASLFGRNGAKG